MKKMSIYENFGVKPILNASGAVTRLGGAPMPEAVLQAFHAAALQTVSLEQLQAAGSRRIAELTGTESGLITAGAAASLTLGTAAILTGYDLSRMEQLPHSEGFPNEIVIAREQRSGYDHAVRAAGARLVEVGFNEIVANAGVRRTEAWEYEAAFNANTAGVVYVLSPNSQPAIEQVVERAHRHNLPVLVDAAGELGDRNNLSAIAASGVDLIAFSGGKSIRGPQSTGILCGRKDLVGAAAVQMLDMDDHLDLWDPPPELIEKEKLDGIPRHGIGRPLKVSKEEIAALLTALDLFASGAYDNDLESHRKKLETIQAELQSKPVSCKLVQKEGVGQLPLLEITLHEQTPGHSAFDVCRRLRNGNPAVYVSHGQLDQRKLMINPLCFLEDDAIRIARRLCQELTAR
jgi:D-glucosaminate-6-phosphate ammonia-lyase